MKKSILFLICTLFGSSMALAGATTNVNAQSVSSKENYAQVTAETAASVYDQNGTKTDIALQKDSTWQVAKAVSINGTDYFQIAPNEFLSTKDSFGYKKRQMTIKVQSSDASDSSVRVYDHNLVQKNDISIANGTRWFSDSAIYTSQGMPFLRIGPDQYVSMTDVSEQQFKATI